MPACSFFSCVVIKINGTCRTINDNRTFTCLLVSPPRFSIYLRHYKKITQWGYQTKKGDNKKKKITKECGEMNPTKSHCVNCQFTLKSSWQLKRASS